MLRENDRVRFVDMKMDKQLGVFNIQHKRRYSDNWKG
jgi:hypothetical protein